MQEEYKTIGRNPIIKNLIIINVFVIFVLILFLFPTAQNSHQNKDKLLDKKKQIESEISFYKQLLNDTKKSKEASLSQLNLIKSQINKREELIAEINYEVRKLDNEIEKNNVIVEKQNQNLNILKDEYARMIYYSYFKNRNSTGRIMLIFSSKDFNQAFQRLKYFQEFNEYRSKQFELINSTKNSLTQKNLELLDQKKSKAELLESNEQEKGKLDSEKSDKDKILKQLKSKESEIAKNLKQKQNEARKLQAKIESVINDEIKKSAVKTNVKVTNTTTIKSVLTTEEKTLSDNFANNKGRLPWPLESGVVVGSYGEHPHPDLPGIKIKNNGIDIATKSSEAKAIFNGIVSGVVTITNNNKAVIIRHGDYFTVYTNLETIYVGKNDKVVTRQNIGKIFSGDGKTELHFEIWQGKILVNPLEWLGRK
jgi:septal ring factor EnvC (AmiA/AmiB activator)